MADCENISGETTDTLADCCVFNVQWETSAFHSDKWLILINRSEWNAPEVRGYDEVLLNENNIYL